MKLLFFFVGKPMNGNVIEFHHLSTVNAAQNGHFWVGQ